MTNISDSEETMMRNNRTTECGNSLRKEDLKIKEFKFN